MSSSKDVSRGGNEERADNYSHSYRENRIHSCGSFNPLNVQTGKYQREKNRPYPIRNAWSKNVGLLAYPDNADHRIEHVIHHHAPTCYVAKRRIDFLPHISKCRSGAGIGPRHPPIADRGEQHRYQRDQDGCDHMAVSAAG